MVKNLKPKDSNYQIYYDMRISELQLSNLVKHFLIREYKERGVEAMCVKEFLPLSAALLYPYKDKDISKDDKISGTIIPIIDSVRKHTKKVRGLTNYTIEGLRLYFQNNWLPSLTIEDQISLIKNISLVDLVEEDGFFSIKGNEIVYEKYLHGIDLLDISQNYGTEVYIVPDYEIGENIGISTNEDMKPGNNSETNERQNGIVSLEPLREFLLTTFPLAKFPNGLKTYDFFWKYKLNAEQYRQLKDILINLDFAKNKKRGLLNTVICGSAYGTVALVVALYISEWYKRESTTLSGDKCLETIGLTSQKTEQIWKSSGLAEELLHQDEEENQMRQMAICALGGLPVGYVNSSKRFEEFVNGLSEVYNTENETTDEEIEKIVNCFDDHNGVFKRSLRSGSCKEYLIKLIEYLESGEKSDLPFCESDLEFPLFSEFVNNLKIGYDKDLPKRFFKPEIRIWTYDFIEEGDDSNIIESEFYVHIGCGNNENKNVITSKDLSKLGVSLPDNSETFFVCLKFTQNDGTSILSEEKRTYFKIGNNCNDFCGAYGSYITTSINLFDIKEISLLIACGNYQKEIYKFKIPQYLELYSTDDFYLWTTKTNNAARKALLYNTSEYIPQNVDESEICFKSNIDNNSIYNKWGWIHQRYNINLVDNNGEIIEVPLGASELIIVDFRTRGLKKNVVLSFDDCVPSVIDGEPGEPVHLLYYSKGQELMLTCDGLKGRELLDNYKLEFKYLHDNRYLEWTNNNRPSQGFIKLRISCRDASKKKRFWKNTVYFIPKNNIIQRNINNHFITIEGNNVYPIKESLLDSFNPKNNKYKDGPNLGLDSPTTSFRIGDLNNYVIVEVYRGFKWQQIWNNGSFIKNVIETGKKLPISIILQRNIKVKTVDENGYHEDSPENSAYIDYFKSPKTIAFHEDNNLSKGLIINSQKAYNSYIYLSRYEDKSKDEIKVRYIEKKDDSIFVYVSDKHIDRYVFYYWSGNLEDTPVKLERKKLAIKHYQYILPSPLSDKAIAFQSMRDCVPNFYFRPFYDNSMKWDYYVGKYSRVTYDYIIKCYSYAVEHNIYFCIFPALRLLQDRNSFTTFIRTYIQQKNYYLTRRDLADLTRLSKELAMDWFFVNRRLLFSKLDEESKQKVRECLKKLLLCSPIERGEHAYSKRFIERFLQDSHSFNERNGRLPRQFLKAFDDFSSYNGCDNIDNRIELLTELVNSPDNIFKEICRILNI